MESSSVCKDTNEVRADENLQTGQDVSNLLVQDEKLTSHLQMSALGNQQKEQILQQLDQLKRDLNKKFMPTEHNGENLVKKSGSNFHISKSLKGENLVKSLRYYM